MLSLALDVQKMDQSLVWKGFFWDLGYWPTYSAGFLENARFLKGRWDFTAAQETGFAKI